MAASVGCGSSAQRVAAPTPSIERHADASHATAAPAPAAVGCDQAVAPLATHWQPSPSAANGSQANFGAARSQLSQALIELCNRDGWPPPSRACLSQADSLRAFDQCLATLPAQQLANVSSTSNAIVAAIPVSAVAP